jgi:predicted kinase
VAGGVVEYCLAHDIRLLAFRPFGGVAGARRLRRDPLLQEISARHGVSAFAVVLAWLHGLSPHVVPLPGPTRPETARDCARGLQLTLDGAEQTALDRRFPVGRLRMPAPLPRRNQAARGTARSQIVMVMGLPGAGKTTYAASLVADGYERLNRDETGGSLASLVPSLERLLERGVDRIVLDNTYVSRASRSGVLDAARARDCEVRGVWLETSLEDAQVNVVRRMLQAHGRLLTSDELKRGGAPEQLSPSALFRAERALERPHVSEGFTTLDVLPFSRWPDPALTNRAVIVWCDGVLRPKKGESALADSSIEARGQRLGEYVGQGYVLLGLAWEPQIADDPAAASEMHRGFDGLRHRLGVPIEIHHCPHPAGPPICWCRKPLPGLGVLMVHQHRLDARQCLYVGSTAQDALFARRLGFEFRTAQEFFA